MSLLLGALCACQIANAIPSSDSALTAAELVRLARTARYQQDSTLSEYRAVARQRWSSGIGIAAAGGLGPLGRTRLAARFESVARVSWHHQRGAWAELIAARAVAPIVGEVEAEGMDENIIYVLPYYPGRDRLWPMTEMADAYAAAASWIQHPLDAGSDSLYRFALGGSLVLTLPGGQVVRLRELQVRPRRPSDRLIVGSLWLDISTGALVRAAYRPSVAMDLWPLMESNFDQSDRDMIGMFGPFRGNVEEVVIEHGLYAGRFWLPRVRIANAEGTAKGGRITLSIEQTFEYEFVAALAPGERQAAQPAPVADRDQRDGRDRYEEWLRRGRSNRTCRDARDPGAIPHDSIPTLDELSIRYSDGVAMRVLIPCLRSALITSSELPPSIYSPSDELFTEQDLSGLQQDVRQALAISNQAEWSPQAATFHYGLDHGLLRFNRVEGLSAGVGVERLLGKGYTLDALARLGAADLEPNGELQLRRETGTGAIRVGAYRRLDAANEWGKPLGLSASLSSLLLGRDDGFFYRSIGAELGGTSHRISSGSALSWRLFAEQQHAAAVETDFSFARVFAGTGVRSNIVATEGTYAGGAATLVFARGEDPMGTQLSGTFKAEAAGGELDYGRGSGELRLAQGLGRGVVGAVTGAAGGSVGDLPPQRLWYLGGAQTIHAHEPGLAAGDAFWMGRAELTKGLPLLRPIIFGDVGWTGDRRDFTTSKTRYLAAGLGVAALDGLLRVDLSRALDSSKRWSFDIFIEVR